MKTYKATKQLGFTLIEMIVSLGVFSVVVTTAVGAMLVLVSTNQQLQAEQSVMTNLSFALDTMTREIRTGFNYNCVQRPNHAADNQRIFSGVSGGASHETSLGNLTNPCPNGRGSGMNLQGVSFYEGGDSITGATARRILYYYDGTDSDNKKIMRRVGNQPPQSIVSSGLSIINAEFVVTGTNKLTTSNDVEQPTVTIYIEAQDRNGSTGKIHYLQTTVTQRTLDL